MLNDDDDISADAALIDFGYEPETVINFSHGSGCH